MSAENRKPSAATTIVRTIIGIALMVGGFWVSKNVHLEFLDGLAKSGIHLDPGKTVAVIGVFLIIFPVIHSFFIGPLVAAINERNQALENTFAEAEALRTEMTQMRTDYERRLGETEAQAREQIQAQIRQAQDLRTEIMAEANSKAEALVKRAQEEIEQQKNRAITEMRLEVVNLTLAATEKVLGENMNDERNRKLIEEFIDKVEVPS